MNINKYISFFLKYINLAVDKFKTKYNSNLSIVAIIKNEAPYILEWIEYHKLIGIKKFYIYDNESTDGTKELLKSYIESGEVVYKYFPGEKRQVKAYNDAILRYRYDSKYMAFIDADEFILPVEEGTNIQSIIESLLAQDKHAAGLALQWCVYGSSGHKKKPDGLVIENYLKHGSESDNNNADKHVKTICNPRKVSSCKNPHFVHYYKNYYSVNTKLNKVEGAFINEYCWDKLRINHYFSKSYEEFLQKRLRGMADHYAGEMRPLSQFESHDYNVVDDKTILRYLSDLKQNLKK